MMKSKRILVPVDGSENSMKAVEYAAELIKSLGGEIVLVHCQKMFPKLLGEPFLQKAINKINYKSRDLVQPYLELLKKAGVEYKERLLEGPPWKVISNAAAIEKCNLIIMGSREFTELQKVFLKSVSQKVLKSASCPVLVVR